MGVSIHPIILGIDNCYIIHGEKIIMIDGGAPKQGKGFMKAIERLSIKPQDIKLIVLTHGHWDHIGSAKEITRRTCPPFALESKAENLDVMTSWCYSNTNT